VYTLVPIPTVNVTPPANQTVGQPLMLDCNVTAVNGITSDVEFVWSRDGEEIRPAIAGTRFITMDSVTYTDTYTIPLLSTDDDDTEYRCEVTINSTSPVEANDSVVLDVMGK